MATFVNNRRLNLEAQNVVNPSTSVIETLTLPRTFCFYFNYKKKEKRDQIVLIQKRI